MKKGEKKFFNAKDDERGKFNCKSYRFIDEIAHKNTNKGGVMMTSSF
jgi:hypothetical protein